MAFFGSQRPRNSPVPENNRNGPEKNSCKPAEQEENHENCPRQAWARSHMGNVSSRLRACVQRLKVTGLSEEEAFHIATQRIGERGALEQEYAKINQHKMLMQTFNRKITARIFYALITLDAALLVLQHLIPGAWQSKIVKSTPTKGNQMLRSWGWLLLLLIVMPTFWAAAEDTMQPLYCASGLYTAKSLDKNKRVFFEAHSGFTIMEDASGKWQITLIYASPLPSQKITTTNIVSFDGSNICSVLLSDKIIKFSGGGIEQRLGSVAEKPGDFGVAAEMSSGPYPIDCGNVVGTLWLAFCSARYLDPSLTEAKFPNPTIADMREDPMAWICKFKYKLMDDKHAIVQHGEYLADPSALLTNVMDYPEIDEPLSSEDAGSFNALVAVSRELAKNVPSRASYELDNFTNINGIAVPLRFHCSLGRFTSSADSPTGYLEGVVTNVTLCSAVLLRPQISGMASIEDKRVRSKGFRNAFWTNEIFYDSHEWILDKNDARIKSVLEGRSYALPRVIRAESPEISAVRSRTVRAVLILSALALILYYVGKRLIGSKCSAGFK